MSNGGDIVPTKYLLVPNQASTMRSEFHLIELLTKGAHGNS